MVRISLEGLRKPLPGAGMAGATAPLPPDAGRRPVATTKSTDIILCPFIVVYDRQERRGGWRFTGLHGDAKQKYRPIVVRTEEKHLKTGDYSIKGFEELLTVERKSSDDFVQTFAQGRARFEREHERMAEMIAAGGRACVVVEGDLGVILDELPLSGRRLLPESVMGTVESWSRRFNVHYYFLGTRARAEKFCFQVLKKWLESVNEPVSRS